MQFILTKNKNNDNKYWRTSIYMKTLVYLMFEIHNTRYPSLVFQMVTIATLD